MPKQPNGTMRDFDEEKVTVQNTLSSNNQLWIKLSVFSNFELTE